MEKNADTIIVKEHLLLIKVKIYTNSLGDSQFLNRLSKYMSIEKDIILVFRDVIENSIKPNDAYDGSVSSINIDTLLQTILNENQKLQGVILDIDTSSVFSRVVMGVAQLPYKIVELELNVNTSRIDTLRQIGFEFKRPHLYWLGEFIHLPKGFKNLRNLESIFNEFTIQDNPKTIVRFNKDLYPIGVVKTKLLKPLPKINT